MNPSQSFCPLATQLIWTLQDSYLSAIKTMPALVVSEQKPQKILLLEQVLGQQPVKPSFIVLPKIYSVSSQFSA